MMLKTFDNDDDRIAGAGARGFSEAFYASASQPRPALYFYFCMYSCKSTELQLCNVLAVSLTSLKGSLHFYCSWLLVAGSKLTFLLQ